MSSPLTCWAEEEGDDGHVGHVADRGLECEVENHEGNAPILNRGLQGNGDNLENGSCTQHSGHKQAAPRTQMAGWQWSDGGHYVGHLGPLLSADQGQPRPQCVAHEAQQRPGHQLAPRAQVEEMLVLPLTRSMLKCEVCL